MEVHSGKRRNSKITFDMHGMPPSMFLTLLGAWTHDEHQFIFSSVQLSVKIEATTPPWILKSNMDQNLKIYRWLHGGARAGDERIGEI